MSLPSLKKTFRVVAPRIGAVSLMAVLISGPALSGSDLPDAGNPPNLLIVVVNCLNKSHLPMYGNNDISTPNLDRFVQESYVFNNLITPATYTPPVMAELFRATRSDRNFFLGRGVDDMKVYEFTDFPRGRSLVDRGYVYLRDRLPLDSSRPFVSFIHLWDLHFPYDRFYLKGAVLKGAAKRLYEKRLADIDSIRLVKTLPDPEAFPALLDFLAFGVRRTELPVNDRMFWDRLLSDLKKTDGSPAAVISAGLPVSLRQRLAEIKSSEQLTPRDKAAIVRTLNGFVCDPASPIGKILLGHDTKLANGQLLMAGSALNTWDMMFVATIQAQFSLSSAVFDQDKDGRLSLVEPMERRNKALLRRIYREALEYILPSLTSLHPQRQFLQPNAESLASWQRSAHYEADLALLKELYDDNIPVIDEKFGQYIEQLRRLGVLDRAIVVFMGDHGESFMEHGYVNHGIANCYDEQINPVLAIRVPGRLTQTKFVDTQLRTADLLPTVMDLMGLKSSAPPEEFEGRSLVPVLEGGSMDITAFSRDSYRNYSVRCNDGWKLIRDIGTNREQLYNVKNDPKEAHDISMRFPQILAEMAEKLNRFLYGD